MSGTSLGPLPPSVINARMCGPPLSSVNRADVPCGVAVYVVNMGKRSRMAAIGLLGYDHRELFVFISLRETRTDVVAARLSADPGS